MDNESIEVKSGVVYVKVALYMNADVDLAEAQEIVAEMDYEPRHLMISHSEVKEVGID